MKKLNKAMVAFGVSAAMLATGFAGIASTAYADTITTGSITITDDAATVRTYKAYQIFKAANYDTTSGALSNVEWGDNISADGKSAFINAVNDLITDSTKKLATDAPAANVAKAIGELNLDENSTAAKSLANVFKTGTNLMGTGTALTKGDDNKYTVDNLKTGYYLVQDETATLTGHEAKTSFLLQVVGNATATPKRAVPTVDKQVEDETDGANPDTSFGDSADHDINETFQFKLIANIPANADRADYDTYMVRFNDTMSSGITFEKINSVVVEGTTATDPAVDATITVTDYTLLGNDGMTPLTGTQKGGKFSVEIADLKALTTDGGSTLDITKDITVTVLYNAHLNEDALIFSGTDADPQVNTNTVDLSYSNNPNGTGEGKTPEKQVYVYSFDMDGVKVDSDDSTIKLTGAEFELYADEDMTQQIKLAQDTQGVYYPDADGTATIQVSATEDDTKGKFSIKGLDNGTYYLKETKAPAGYNLPSTPFAFTIAATHSVNAGTPTATLTNGRLVLNLENTKGSKLPETGGMGTVALYTAGAAIVLFAGLGLTLAMKRRNA